MIDTFRRPALLVMSGISAGRAPISTEQRAIGRNLVECRACQSRWFTLACAGEAVHRFLAPRLITTVLAAAALWAALAALA